MAACPNCGRQTLRTKDWACQWCGYPLVSRAYKKIDKTYRELQEERNLTARMTQPEEEPEFEPEREPEPKPAPEPEPEPAPESEPKPTPKPKPKPVPQPEPEPEPQTLPEPEPEKEEPVMQLPPPEAKPEPAPEPAPEAESPAEPEKPQEPLITPPPEPKQELPPAKPEIKVDPQPAPQSTTKLEDIQDGTELTADDIDAIFRSDKSGAHSKFTEKTLVIKGIVEKVFVREHLDIRYIVMTGARKRMTWSLRCTFNKEESSKLTRLTEGEEVKVRGKYDGFSKNIIFKDCELV
ncbi:MAG: hypothetical protein A2Y89_02380 [Chloroflexi bacterium RBG_13_51_18]|nr:MAG: hypothetical protein A2Y89_02380 [Chloroflexi bacterium RBG_13_51_18]